MRDGFQEPLRMESMVIGGSIYHGGVTATSCELHSDFIHIMYI